jgi:uncharacterized protein YbjT (DUF2867 family)
LRKGEAWAAKGCELAVADFTDVDALTEAFRDAEGVFVLPPPIFDPEPGFQESYTAMTALRDAVRNSGAGKVLYLSTIGAQAKQTNLLSQHTIGEFVFGQLEVPVTFLRPAWFLENAAWDIASARDNGVIHSFLQPLDRQIPMVAIDDIGRLAAELVQESWSRQRVVELEGRKRVAPIDVGTALAKALKRDVKVEAVPRDSWEALFVSQGMRNPYPRIRMIDGFNEGWISFESSFEDTRKGSTTVDAVLGKLTGSAEA